MFELQNTIIRRIFATIFAVEQLVRSLLQRVQAADISFTVPNNYQNTTTFAKVAHTNYSLTTYQPFSAMIASPCIQFLSRCIFHWSSALMISFNESCCTLKNIICHCMYFSFVSNPAVSNYSFHCVIKLLNSAQLLCVSWRHVHFAMLLLLLLCITTRRFNYILYTFYEWHFICFMIWKVLFNDNKRI